jgi:hypothetical protein
MIWHAQFEVTGEAEVTPQQHETIQRCIEQIAELENLPLMDAFANIEFRLCSRHLASALRIFIMTYWVSVEAEATEAIKQ